MADYDWFDRDHTRQKPSDSKIYGEAEDFEVTDRDNKVGPKQLNKDVQKFPVEAWCNFCQCSVRPYVWAMRQHRHVCNRDPRIAG